MGRDYGTLYTYGTPVAEPKEVAPGVFEREWPNGLVRFDCTTFAWPLPPGRVIDSITGC